MKRIRKDILAGVLFIMMLSAVTAAEAAAQDSFEMNKTGVGFDLPEALQDLKGTIQPGYENELGEGSGLWLSTLTYCAMSKEKYSELAGKGANLTQEDIDFIQPRMIDFIFVYSIDGGRTPEDVSDILSSYGLPSEGDREIGTAGDYRFFCLSGPSADDPDSEYVFDEGFREEYDTVAEACEEPDWIRVYEPEETPKAEAGSVITFETTDLDGNTVRSEDLFSAHRLTMVNLWGTYCGPCIGEMPDLEELNARLTDKDCGIIGIVCDAAGAEDQAHIDSAKEIVADTGVTYQNLIPWDGFSQALPSAFIPTTYFVDSKGQIAGEPAIGARGADDYEALIDALLETMEE